MKQVIKSIAVLLALLLATGCTQPAPQGPATGGTPANSAVTAPPAQGPESGVTPAPPSILANPYYDVELIASGCAAPDDYRVEGRLRGGMVPHHLLATGMIAGFFSLAAQQHRQQPYDAVLLVAPSHFPENCGSDAVTARLGWDSGMGPLQPDLPLAQAILADSTLAAEDNPAAVQADHGVAGLTPYLAKYLPDVPVTVCLLSNKLSQTRLEAFQNTVAAQFAERNLLVVASADCSHYLTPATAAPRDEQTAQAVLTGDRQTILGFSDKNVDSPQAVTTLLRIATELDTLPIQLGHSSSNQMLPLRPGSTAYIEGITTYFVFAVVS